VRITTDRAADRNDPFDRLARVARRLPGAARLQRALETRKGARRLAWFVAIYVVSVFVFGSVALFLNAIVPK
jgi:hypothetical protein